MHYANKNTAGTRYYRDGDDKLGAAVTSWNGLNLDFVMVNGDLIDGTTDQATTEAEYDTIGAVLAGASAPMHFSLGNHELEQLTKAQWRAKSGQPDNYYSFDAGAFHFIVLDPCYRSDNDADHYSDGNFDWAVAYVPPDERTWLAADLAATARGTVVFCHYRLSGNDEFVATNAAAVRAILEASGKVLAVFNGHVHENDKDVVNGIPYYAMQAMTEGAYPLNAYGVVRLYADNRVTVTGYGQQTSYL